MSIFNFDKKDSFDYDTNEYKYNNIQDLLDLFNKVRCEMDREKRNELEKKINQLKFTYKPFINSIYSIMTSQDINLNYSSILLMLTSLKNFLPEILDRIAGMEKEVIELVNAFLPIIRLGGYFNKQMCDIINECLNKLLRSPFISKSEQMVFLLLDYFLNEAMNNLNYENVFVLFQASHTILNADIELQIFVNSYERAKTIVNTIHIFIQNYFDSMINLNNQNELVYFIKILNLKKSLYEIIFMICMKLKRNSKFTEVIKEEFIEKYLENAIECSQYEIDKNVIKFLHISDNPNLDKAINLMKGKSLMWISMLIQYDGAETISNYRLINCAMRQFEYITKGFTYIIKNYLDYLSRINNNLEDETKDNEYNTLVFQACLFLSRVLIREPLVSTMVSNIKA